MKLVKHIMMAAGAVLVTAPLALPSAASAQEWPMVDGEYSVLSGIYVKDGGSLKYAEYLASQWVKDQEFAKSQGWISSYKMFSSVNRREGEPNVYLMVTFPSMPDAAESERRYEAYDAWAKKSISQQVAASGNRAEFRTVQGSMMLQEFKVR